MKPLPQTEETLLLRTDFSDDDAWQAICAAVRVPDPELQEALDLYAEFSEVAGQPIGELEAFRFIDDPDYAGVTMEQIIEDLDVDSSQTFLFVVDEEAISHPDHPILVVDLFNEPGRSFRSVPSQAFAIESNLSIANMDWEEFAGQVDGQGVFRGFPK